MSDPGWGSGRRQIDVSDGCSREGFARTVQTGMGFGREGKTHIHKVVVVDVGVGRVRRGVLETGEDVGSGPRGYVCDVGKRSMARSVSK